MEAFTYYQGKTIPLMNDNIDTDQILPKNYLKRVEKTGFGNTFLMTGAIYQIAVQILNLF